MIQIMFVRSPKIGSWLIRKVTGEDCSHVAIYCPEYGVFESTFSGVRQVSLDQFLNEHDVCHTINYQVPSPVRHNTHMMMWRLSKLVGQKAGYDYGALVFLALRLAARKLWLPFPKKNLWQQTGMFLCVELVTKAVYGTEDSMLTPHQLYNKLQRK
jgi:hypothetical protein